MLFAVHSFDRFDDQEFALMGDFLVADYTLAIGQLLTMHCAPAATLSKPELPEPGLYGCRATPQKVGKALRRKPFDHIFFVEKTLVEIPWRFGNFNGINEISGWRRKAAFSWRRPTILKYSMQ